MNVKEGINEKPCKLCMYSYNSTINITSIEYMTGMNTKQGCKYIKTVNKIFKKKETNVKKNAFVEQKKLVILYELIVRVKAASMQSKRCKCSVHGEN